MKKKALFVAPIGTLRGAIGGLQACAAEFIYTLEESGFDLEKVEFHLNTKRSFFKKVYQKLVQDLYSMEPFKEISLEIEKKIIEKNIGYVFFYTIEFLPIIKYLRQKAKKGTKYVILSAGLTSADMVHYDRIKREMPFYKFKFTNYNINKLIKKEMEYLPDFHGIISISEVESSLCKWLGASKSTWVPRIIQEKVFKSNPVKGWHGFVGTLEHPPSFEGLFKVLKSLSNRQSGIKIRLVSRSTREANFLKNEFKEVVDNLGPLEGEMLVSEASKWCTFLNPFFCFARGCSTKLATGLEWKIPCITTESGARGYDLSNPFIVIAKDVEEYKDILFSLSDPEELKKWDVYKKTEANDNKANVLAIIKKFIDG